jgi:hypothetical protein
MSSVRRNSSGNGSARKASTAVGSVAIKEPDRPSSEPGTLARRNLVELLNGDSNPGIRGFRAETYDEDKILFVPYGTTNNWDEALLLCRHGGLIASKLNAMTPTMAWTWYFTTLPRPEAMN